MRIILFLISFFILFAVNSSGQTLGQDPWSAYPVCGTAKFEQKLVPIQAGRPIPSPCPASDGLRDINPFYYQFTVVTTGSLGFEITPLAADDDYDWQLFDITNHDPSEILTNGSLFVACNWSEYFGKTGAATTGSSLVNCAGKVPIWSSMPTVTKGHTYLLLVSHFLDNQNGYTLEFKGGSASIYDPLEPAVKLVRPDCSGNKLAVSFNKKLRCNSLAADGSDFALDLPGYKVVSAKSVQCSRGFDMDSVELTLDKNLAVGSYKLWVKTGTDGNRVLDYCDRPVDSALQVSFKVLPLAPTPMDSLTPPTCAPNHLDLVFGKFINCNSITSNGSEFSVTGPMAVSVQSVTVNCTNGYTNKIRLNLASPVVVGGTYSVILRTGGDGNTLLDECAQATPAGSEIQFFVKDTVSAAFSIQQFKGCKQDTFFFRHDGAHGVTNWSWTFPDQSSSVFQRPVFQSSFSGTSSVQLVVSNGFCADTAVQTIQSDERVKAAMTAANVVCPADLVSFVDASSGAVSQWIWDFGNGTGSALQNPPPQSFVADTRDRNLRVRLIVSDLIGCADTVEQNLLVVSSCIIVVPNAFTPNNDGRNDYLYPSNAYKADQLLFRIFNRFGQLVFETRDWTRKWDGRRNGRDLEAGTYVWTLQYIHHDTGRRYALKGATVLLR